MDDNPEEDPGPRSTPMQQLLRNWQHQPVIDADEFRRDIDEFLDPSL